MRHFLLFALLTSTVSHAGYWPTDACLGITEVTAQVEVSLNDSGNKDIQKQLEDRIRTSTRIRLRSAGISINDESIAVPNLFVTISLLKVDDTSFTTYDVSVELVERVFVGRTGRSTTGITGSSHSRGWGGAVALSRKINEELDAQLNEFINCVLEARDKAGELKSPPKTKKRATVSSEGK